MLTKADSWVRQHIETMETVEQVFLNMDMAAKTEHALSATQSHLKTPNASEIRILYMLLKSVKRSDSLKEQSLENFSTAVTWLCNAPRNSFDASAFHLATTSILQLLRDQSWLFPQAAIDSLLSSLIATSHPSGEAFMSPSADRVFLKICALTHTLISLYRKQLGGRSHLLAKLLQRLLVALHQPIRPGLALPSSSGPFSKDHAAAYARVLATLCEPTQSSVARYRRADDLTDETKKVKREVGEYVRNVIIEFCSAQLEGRLGDGMRDALNPGLWAAMEVIGEDGLKALSSGLNHNTRAVFRGVVADWKKFGRSGNR